MRQRIIPTLFLILLIPAMSARAEVFVINGGGTIEGKLLSPNQRSYQINVGKGMTLALDSKMVLEKTGEGREAERMYDSFAPLEPDTVESHLKIAAWCSENYLTDLAKVHWNRVLDLDPENTDARRKLGYTRDRVTGEWSTTEKRMESRGYIYDKGRWKLPQEVWIEERTTENNKAVSRWKQQLRRIRSAPLAEQNQQFLLNITDPAAVGPIMELLQEENRPDVRILYLRVLSNIGTSPAIEILTKSALSDPIEEVRRAALEQIIQYPVSVPLAGSYFAKRLTARNSDGTSRLDSEGIQRAAFAIAEIGDVNSIGALISVLITRHKEVKVQGSSGISGGFTPGGGNVGFGTGQAKQEYIREIQNEMVLFALKKLTGFNFQYNQEAWTNWFREQQKPVAFNARREN